MKYFLKNSCKGLLLFSLIIVPIALLTTAYDTNPDGKAHPIKLENVARVFMSKTDEYIFLVETTRNKYVPKRFKADEVIFIADVPGDQSMWVNIITTHTNLDWVDVDELQIHIHSAENVNSSGWGHGKHGKGQTHIIE